MRVGIGLPTTIPGVDGHAVVDWARRADAGPFTSLGVLDRLVYDSFDALVALAAAAAVTERVRLVTMVAVAPLRNTALFAKSVASLDALASGRLVLGLAVGARHEDYAAAGVDHATRGRRFTQQLAALREHWEDGAFGPGSARRRGPELLVGGLSDQAYSRVARYADGYVHGGGPPRAFARAADKARAAWTDAGRPGRPLLWAQGYFALGDPDTAAAGADYLRHYYAFTGPFAEKVAAGQLTSPQAIAQFLQGYAEAGCDEMVLLPTVGDPAQIDRLADVLGTLAELADAPGPQRPVEGAP
jgi:alkanesulfonate monooxygenase SsuD/methylene tetrahydromethanopterin reductase-like flavin-dependent oxidoreductase (luciferase family)